MLGRPILSTRWLLPLLAPAVLAAQAVPGRYDFHARTVEGTLFDGTIYLIRIGDRLTGRVFTTVRSPLAVSAVVVDSFVTVRAGMVSLRWRVGEDSLAGEWRIGEASGPFQGRRRPLEADQSLAPVPCRVLGVRDVVRCGVRVVAEDRDDPRSRRIPLNLVILPATRPEGPEGALFLLAGGPGQASTAGAGVNARRYAAIRERRDLVMVDQRGTGGSNGLFCEFRSVDERAAALFAGFFPLDAVERCRRELSGRADLRQYHTAVAARDLDDVRGWLGYDRIDLYGGSYGTRAALAYLRAFPSRVRTLTLRAILPPSKSLVADNPRTAEAALERLFRACADDAGCHRAYPSPAGELRELLARLDRSPPAVRVPDPVTGDTVTLALTRGVMAGAIRRMLMDPVEQRRLPLALHRARAGDFDLVRPGIEATVAVAGDLAWGMGLSVVCAEDPPIVRRRGPGATDGTFMGRGQVDGMMAACAGWDAGAPPPGYDLPVTSPVPALLLSGALDPTTPAEWGEEVARSLPQALHLVLPGVSHGPFPDCALAIMAAMVAAGTADGLDRSCVGRLTVPPLALPGPG